MPKTEMTSAPGRGRAGGAPAAPADPKRWWALAVLALAQLMSVLDASIVDVALPSPRGPTPAGPRYLLLSRVVRRARTNPESER